MSVQDIEGFKGTPGEWSVSKGSDQFVCADSAWIASTMGTKGPEGAANARLMAASKALLRACLAMQAAYRTQNMSAGSRALDEIDAAISRALGKDQ